MKVKVQTWARDGTSGIWPRDLGNAIKLSFNKDLDIITKVTRFK